MALTNGQFYLYIRNNELSTRKTKKSQKDLIYFEDIKLPSCSTNQLQLVIFSDKQI
jgi:hypothetical protein